jgi:hypothetical protein
MRRRWGWDNAHQNVDKEIGGSRSCRHRKNKRTKGGKQKLGYQHGWGVGRDHNEEDDLWSCCSYNQTSNFSRKGKCQAIFQEWYGTYDAKVRVFFSICEPYIHNYVR